VKQAMGMDIDDELPDIPESLKRPIAASTAEKDHERGWEKKGVICPYDLESLDAVEVTCSMPAVLQMLIPVAAVRFHAGENLLNPHHAFVLMGSN
jgi:hypothetical protein